MPARGSSKSHMAGRTAHCVPVSEKPPRKNGTAQRQLSGSAVANLMHATGNTTIDAAAAEQNAPHSVRARPQRSHFSSPTDFYAGPNKPGGVTRGIRRYNGPEQDMVGKMLTDDYLMSSIEVHKRTHDPHPQMDNACNVLAEEQPYRRATKQLNCAQALDAPYFEDNDPKPPREAATPSGRKHFKSQIKPTILPGTAAPTADDIAAAVAPKPARAAGKYKSNRSHDILHLDRYQPNELNEVRATNRQHRICKASAPEMPAAKRPTMRRVTAHAKEEHDVLGSGRFGKPEAPPCTGVAHCGTRAKKGTLNLFAPPPPAKSPQAQEQSSLTKSTNTNSLLRYYDPAVDAPQAPVKVRAQAYRANRESCEVPQPPHRKAAGMYSGKNSQRTCDLHWDE